jgi:tetratricopeptide (TPR) repeat protein
MTTSSSMGTGQYAAYDEHSQYIYGVRETRKQNLKSKLEKRPLPSTYGQQALQLLVILLQMGRIQDAIKDFTTAIELKNFVPAYTNRGTAFNIIDRFQEAKLDFDTALAIEPNFRAALFNRGITSYRLGLHQDSIADFTLCLELNPRDIETYLSRVRCLFELERYTEASEDVETALEIDPSFVECYVLKAVLQAAMGNILMAVKCVTTAIELDDLHAYAYFLRSTILKACGVEQWRSDRQKAMELDSTLCA